MADSEEATLGPNARIDALEAKIRGLEENNKARSRSILILGLALMFFVVWSTYLNRNFSGRWLGLHDQSGTLRTWVDDQGLELKDTSGNTRARLGIGLDGSPSLQFFDAKHQLRTHLFIYTDGSSYLMMWDKDGKGVPLSAAVEANALIKMKYHLITYGWPYVFNVQILLRRDGKVICSRRGGSKVIYCRRDSDSVI